MTLCPSWSHLLGVVGSLHWRNYSRAVIENDWVDLVSAKGEGRREAKSRNTAPKKTQNIQGAPYSGHSAKTGTECVGRGGHDALTPAQLKTRKLKTEIFLEKNTLSPFLFRTQ